jgi:hypothetical protein
MLIRAPRGTFGTQALLCTDLAATPEQILGRFVPRWQVEVTFEEARRPLGLETQRQWSDLAIRRATPALLGLFSLLTLLAHPYLAVGGGVRQAAWYCKPLPTFADALALVRRHLWGQAIYCTSAAQTDVVQVPHAVVDRLTEARCYAA